MTISVTQQHIDKGDACSCVNCPLALAFNAAGFPGVSVGPVEVDFYAEQTLELLGTLRLPNDARWFIGAFDRWRAKGLGPKPAPFTFEMPGLTTDLRSCFPDSFEPVPVV